MSLITIITVEWGYEHHSLALSRKDWDLIKAGQSLRIRGDGYYYEGDFFWDYWFFGGGLDGILQVDYGEDGATGFVGKLRDALIEHRNEGGNAALHIASSR